MDESPVFLLIVGPVISLAGLLILRYWDHIDKFSVKYLGLRGSQKNYNPLVLWAIGGVAIFMGLGMAMVGIQEIFPG